MQHTVQNLPSHYAFGIHCYDEMVVFYYAEGCSHYATWMVGDSRNIPTHTGQELK